MKGVSKPRLGMMGKLNNAIIVAIDENNLTPIEVIIVLEQLVDRMRTIFNGMVEGKK